MAKYLFVMANEGHRWGGSEPLWSQAAEKLARKANEVRVTVKDWGKRVPQVERLRTSGCQIFYRDERIPPFLKRQIRRIFQREEFALRHMRIVSSGVDLIVISQGENKDGLRWIEAARASGHRYAIIAQSAVVYWWPEDSVAERLAACYEGASAAYFVSQANLELSQRQFGSALGNAKVVRNPFNVRYEARPPWPGDSADGLSLACIGRLDVISKAQDLLLDVLSLPRWRGRKVRLTLAGSGPFERCLRRMTQRLGLRGVEFRGFVENIEEFWSTHHALVLPSRFEGMPLAVVEAMLCGRPCIATDVGGNRELIRDGVNGFLAKAPTVEFVDEAMNRAWENRERLREMGESAASDARRWVSADPGEDFARELAGLANQGT
jgi:glycosyltransferase involved in cell wall biosynthesis